MLKEKFTRFSTNLNKNMNVTIYGHYGFAMLMFPSLTDSCEENEKNGIIEAIAPYIEKGKVKVFSIDTVNAESWDNDSISPENKSKRHFEYNNYLIEELIPFIYEKSNGPVPIILCGAAKGAFHAANTFFRRPDVFLGCIAVSGIYDISWMTKGYWDDNCYFNSPVHYLPNLTDSYWLSYLTSRHHCYLFSGSGNGEFPDQAKSLGEILNSKGIRNIVEIWSNEWEHNYKTWAAMIANILETRL